MKKMHAVAVTARRLAQKAPYSDPSIFQHQLIRHSRNLNRLSREEKKVMTLDSIRKAWKLNPSLGRILRLPLNGLVRRELGREKRSITREY